MSFDVLVFLAYVFEAYIAHLYFKDALYPKIPWYYILPAFLIGYTGLFGVYMLNIRWLGYVAFFLVNFIITIFCFQTSFWKTVVHNLLFGALGVVSRYIVLCLYYVTIGEWQDYAARGLARVVLNDMHLLLFFVSAKVIASLIANRRYHRKMTRMEEMMFFLPLATFSMLTGILLLISEHGYGRLSNFFIAYGAQLLLCSNMIVFYFHERMQYHMNRAAALEMQEQRQKFSQEYYQMAKALNEEQRIALHDIKNHLTGMYALAVQEGNKKIVDYIDALMQGLAGEQQVYCTGNEMLDIVLTTSGKRANKAGIDFQVENDGVNLGFIADQDVCSMMMNLFDNATESCQRSENKQILVQMYVYEGRFHVIKVTNSCDVKPRKIRDAYQSSKEHQEHHGFGMRSIARTVKNYNGRMETYFDAQGRTFQTLLVFPAEQPIPVTAREMQHQ